MKKKKEKLDVRNYATELKMLSTSFLEDLADSETENEIVKKIHNFHLDVARIKYKQVFETLGLTCWRDDLYCSDISKITYRNTVLYEREVAYE